MHKSAKTNGHNIACDGFAVDYDDVCVDVFTHVRGVVGDGKSVACTAPAKVRSEVKPCGLLHCIVVAVDVVENCGDTNLDALVNRVGGLPAVTVKEITAQIYGVVTACVTVCVPYGKQDECGNCDKADCFFHIRNHLLATVYFTEILNITSIRICGTGKTMDNKMKP